MLWRLLVRHYYGMWPKYFLQQIPKTSTEGLNPSASAYPLKVSSDRFPMLREGETLIEYICRVLLAVYEIEWTRLGSHSAAAYRLGMHRNTLYDWLEWARQRMTK
jgi:hypothetical protein